MVDPDREDHFDNGDLDQWKRGWHLIIEIPRVLNVFQFFAEFLATQWVSKPELTIQLKKTNDQY